MRIIELRSLFLLASCCFAGLAASTLDLHFARRDLSADGLFYARLVARTSPKASSSSKDTAKDAASSSQPQRQASPPPTNDSRRSSTPRPSSSTARYTNPLSMARGPIKVPDRRIPLRRGGSVPAKADNPTSPRSNSPTSPRSRSPSPPHMLSGHPASSMVVAEGPGAIQVGTGRAPSQVVVVPAGEIRALQIQDPHSTFATGFSYGSGRAVAASSGPSVAAMGEPKIFGEGYLEAHQGSTERRANVKGGHEKTLRAEDHQGGRYHGGALAMIEGPGQAGVVALKKVDNPTPRDRRSAVKKPWH